MLPLLSNFFARPLSYRSAQGGPTAGSISPPDAPTGERLSESATVTSGSTSSADRRLSLPAVTLLAQSTTTSESTATSGILSTLIDTQITLGMLSTSSSGPSSASSSFASSSSKSMSSDTVVYRYSGQEAFETLNLENFHEWEFDLAQDYEKFEQADNLIAAGETLPAMRRPASEFSTKSGFFRYLKNNPAELYIYLKQGADVNGVDEFGATLLHHVAQVGLVTGPHRASIIMQLLFNTPGVNFGIKDLEGNTPLHVAASHCRDRVTCRTVFPAMARAAMRHGFDFATKDTDGSTILHIAARQSYFFGPTGIDKNVSKLVSILRGIGVFGEQGPPIPNLKEVLDTLSDSGLSALYSCLTRLRFSEVISLLEAGASLYAGTSDRMPLDELAKHRLAIEVMAKEAASAEPGKTQEPLDGTEPQEGLERFKVMEDNLARFESQLKPYMVSEIDES